MKILCAFHDIQDPGGITNHQEHLTLGLRSLGHTVEARLLVWRISTQGARSAPSRGKAQTMGELGMLYDQQFGWFWPREKRFAYAGNINIAAWQRYASQFDLVIWQIPTVTQRKDQVGNSDWVKLYDLPETTRQIAVVHDGNLPDAYPWIYAVAPRLTGIVGVHPCGYTHALKVPVPCALIPNPHWNIAERMRVDDGTMDTGAQRTGWFSCQTFKGRKHVADIIRAVPHMTTERKIMAGGGIEYHYMTSQTKVKPAYVTSRDLDPDCTLETLGIPIWDVAVRSGMNWCGYLTNEERDYQLEQSRFMIDPSWSKKYSRTGDHFNRTPIEGIIAGCVPIARNLGVSTNEAGVGLLFKPDENYVMVPHDATPRQFAGIVDEACAMPEGHRQAMLHAGREMLSVFDARYVAQCYVDLAERRETGVKWAHGVETPELRAASDRTMKQFFGVDG